MSHSRYEELLAVYRDLQGPERDELDRHLRECPACTARLAAYEAMDRELGALRDPRPGAQLCGRFLAAAAARRRWSRLGTLAGYLAEAALAVLLVISAWLAVQGGIRSGQLAWPGTGRTPTAAPPTAAAMPTVEATVTPSPPPGTLAYAVDFGDLGALQKAASFQLLLPTFIPEDLPFSKASLWRWTNGDETVRILYAAPGDPLDANRKAVDLQLTLTDRPVTGRTLLQGQGDGKEVPVLDLEETRVRGWIAYSYWQPSVAAGNWAVLTWRQGALNVRITLFGNWPFPGEQNPHGLDALLVRIAESLPASGDAPQPTVVVPSSLQGEIAYIGADGRLWLMAADGRNQRQLTGGGALAPAWSPDGRTLAYVELASGSRQAVLYDPASQERTEFGAPDEFLGRVSWSPSGRYLLLDGGTSAVRGLTVYELATGKVVAQLSAAGYTWSPGGDRLAFGRRRPVQPSLPWEIGGSLSLAVLQIGQAEPEVILEGTPEAAYSPRDWLPDGRLLLYRTRWKGQTAAGQDLLTMRPDDPAAELLPAVGIPLAHDPEALLARLPAGTRNTPAIGSFSWALDGRWVAFQAGDYPDWGIYLYDTGQWAAPRRLADGTAPAWQPVRPPAPTPVPTPDLQAAEVYTTTFTSPDGQWVATTLAALPSADWIGPGNTYYTRLTVARTDGSVSWTAVDEWLNWGLGYTWPIAFHWSRDGRYLYFTNLPHPDGCPYLVNGWDLWRLDLQDGHVDGIAPGLGLWLALSPDETTLAASCSGQLVLRDLASGNEREARLTDEGYTPAGAIAWAPDGSALVLAVAHNVCSPLEVAHSILRVDAQTLALTTLVDRDSRCLSPEAWPEPGRVLLKDKDAQAWWLDALTGEVTAAE